MRFFQGSRRTTIASRSRPRRVCGATSSGAKISFGDERAVADLDPMPPLGSPRRCRRGAWAVAAHSPQVAMAGTGSSGSSIPVCTCHSAA